jgi:hypothetical protein
VATGRPLIEHLANISQYESGHLLLLMTRTLRPISVWTLQQACNP